MKEDRIKEYNRRRYCEEMEDLLRSRYGIGYIVEKLLEIDDEISDPNFEIPKGFLTPKEFENILKGE